MYQNLLLKLNNLFFWTKSKLTKKQFIFLASILVGALSSSAVIILKAFAHWVFYFASYINTILKLSFINSILPIIGILLTVFVVDFFLGGTIEKGTSQILFTVAKKSSIISKKQMYAQIITSSLTVGLGGSAGLESPIVITGAAFGSNFGQRFRLNYKDRTLLIGCGVAGGIAAAFNAPIAGVLFAVEVLLVDVSLAAFTPIMIAAATGALISAIVLDENVLLSFKQQQNFDYHNIPFYILLGVFTGLISIFYSRYFQKTEHFFLHLKFGAYRNALIGASLLALLIFVFPALFGEGYENIKILAESDPGKLLDNTIFSDLRNNSWALLSFLGLTMMLKTFATGITLGSGGNGGNFAPSLFIGSYAGFFLSKLFNITGLTRLPISNFTIVGMAGILSGLFHAPLTAIFLIAEITGGYNLMIPLMIVASISFAISKRYEKHSLDLKNLAKKGHAFTNNKDKNILSVLQIESIINKDFSTVYPEDKLEKLTNFISHSDQIDFAVINERKELVGIVYFNDIREVIFDNSMINQISINQIMKQPIDLIYSFDNMETVMAKFEKSKKDFLPVLRNGKYYGIISKSKTLEAYRTKLKSMLFE